VRRSAWSRLDGGLTHRWRFIEGPWLVISCGCPLAVSLPRPPCATYSLTGAESTGPGTRSARAKARRRTAASTHRRSGCNHAPRPGMRRRGSGTTCAPGPATTRSSSAAAACRRHPMHVRIGRCGVTVARSAEDSDAVDEAAAMAESTPRELPEPTRPTAGGSCSRRRCECRSDARSAERRGGHSVPPGRWRGRVGSPAPRRGPAG
jgi:hypothetical protein